MSFCVLIVFACISSCQKDTFNNSEDARIDLSADTLYFDTVFTSVGSVTQSFKIINPNNQKLKLSSIELAGGASSPFKININGVPANELSNEIIGANDSIYVFVQVFVNPDNSTTPFILKDSIGIRYNGIQRWMQLRAYGRNAIFLNNKKVTADTTWNNLLPIVITGQLLVDSNTTLNISKGTRVFVHATAPIIVNGTLKAGGSTSEPVVFSGDRMDAGYKDLPAAWPGIFLSSSSTDNEFKAVVIKNAYQGLIVEDMADNGEPKVVISQTRIENIYDAGILAVRTSIRADNSLFANCGANLQIALGGDYSFVNCTIASYGDFYIPHTRPVVQVADYFDQAGTSLTADLKASFVNCILWGDNGSVDNEISITKKGNGIFDLSFDHCIYKAKDEIANARFEDCFLNTPPLFDSIQPSKNLYDFHIRKHPESPATKGGTPTSYPFDLEGKPRTSQPDLGCYEN